MRLTYDEGEIQPEQRVAPFIIYPLLIAAVAAIIVTVIITKMSPMHVGS